MARRLELQTLLEGLAPNVYFQPPLGTKMQYPCIIYARDSAVTKHADNKPYRYTQRYLVTVVDRNADSSIPPRVAMLPQCEFSRYYAVDGLNHDVFNLFF